MKNVRPAILESIQTLACILIAVGVFRGFVASGFVIPTGSMADTLRGAHFHLTCHTCGYEYNFGFNPERYINPHDGHPWPKGYRPDQLIPLMPNRLRNRGANPVCPLCGTAPNPDLYQHVSRGDQIWVIKCFFQFFEPKNWDVIVFKSPTNPREDYIKRLIGLPGQTIQVIDGDVYIDDKIAQKPPRVQDSLWIKIFHSDFQPPSRRVDSPWQWPFKPTEESTGWKLDQKMGRLEFAPTEKPLQNDMLVFDRQRIAQLTLNLCPYNGNSRDPHAISSDLKLSFMLLPTGNQGQVSLILGKYDRTYQGRIDFNGLCTISNDSTGEVLAQQQFEPLGISRPVQVFFENVDHKLTIGLGDDRLEYLGPDSPQDWGYNPSQTNGLPSVAVAGAGDSFTLERIILERDNYYTNSIIPGSNGRGTEGNPITLAEDEFFVLGDNSPMSFDSRFWDTPGKGDGKQYRQGIVPRDYLLGKPLGVYWPAGYRLHPNIPIAFIPNMGQMRFIY